MGGRALGSVASAHLAHIISGPCQSYFVRFAACNTANPLAYSLRTSTIMSSREYYGSFLIYVVRTVTDNLMHTVYICSVILTITIDCKIAEWLTLYSNLLFSECLQCVGLSVLLFTWKPLKESASLFQGVIDPVSYCLRCYWFVWFYM